MILPGSALTRRRFVKGVSAALAMAALPTRASQQLLSGRVFDLNLGYQQVNFTGKDRIATTVNDSLPAPVLRWKEGDTVTLRVHNGLADDSSIHWHGLILPSSQDGVPHISEGFTGIKPGETFTYRFPVKQSGTYWYHSHSDFQEQTGLYGAIIIDPIEPEPFSYDRDYVVVLSDWSDTKPETIFHRLKKLSHYYNYNERTVLDLAREIGEEGIGATWNSRVMWNDMTMSDRDLADVTGFTYTYLMNGSNPATGWTGLFKRGEKIRLRFINAAAMTIFDVRIPGVKMRVIESDGQGLEPVTVDEVRIGVAETYDVLIEPEVDACTVFAQSIDRSGYALGRLVTDASLQPEVPALDEPQSLTHADMGMGHSGHMSPSAGMDHHSHHGHSKPDLAMGSGKAGFGSAQPVTHAPTEVGPGVDMLAEAPAYRLDDPGVGLRSNGRRVLLYEDLRNLHPTPDPREPSREIDLHLNGNMTRYMWSFNGIPYDESEPIVLKYGERVRINLVNDTMMTHPIHLHGMWSDLETGNAEAIPRKHTVLVQPGSRLSYLVTADAPGAWAYHCHLIFHMAGMFRKVVVV